jgi:ubiquinol-cytochrome c reductase iron-sulfur subunit
MRRYNAPHLAGGIRQTSGNKHLMSDAVDLGRRHFLTVTTTVAGGVGIIAVATPFLASLKPSARAQALGAPVEVDVSKIEPGARITVEWRGKPIYIVRRTPEALAALEGLAPRLRDPASESSEQPSYAQNVHRSLRPEIFVVVGVCTHLGCAPLYRPEVAAPDLGGDWPGGFFCPCHGSRFDLAGRVFAGVPAPLNLAVPPYRFVGDSLLVIGDDAGASA